MMSRPIQFVDSDSGLVKRPPNSYILFCCYLRPILKEKLRKSPEKHLTKLIATVWKNLSKVQKKPYQDKADKLNNKHRRLFPTDVHIHKHIVQKDIGTVNKDSAKDKTGPILIQPVPGPVAPIRIPSPVDPPWSDRYRRPNPNPQKKTEDGETIQIVQKKIEIRDPKKVKFRVVPKYRPSKYIPTFKSKRAREARLMVLRERENELCNHTDQKVVQMTPNDWDQISLSSLDDILDLSVLNFDFDIEDLLKDISFPEHIFSKYDTACPDWYDLLCNRMDTLDQQYEQRNINTQSFSSQSVFLNSPGNDNLVDVPNNNDNDINLIKCFKTSEIDADERKERSQGSKWWHEFNFLRSPQEQSPAATPTLTNVSLLESISDIVEPCGDQGCSHALLNPQFSQNELGAHQFPFEMYTCNKHNPGLATDPIQRNVLSCENTEPSTEDEPVMYNGHTTNNSLDIDIRSSVQDNHDYIIQLLMDTEMLSQDALLQDIGYTPTPNWERIAHITPSVVSCSTSIFTNSSSEDSSSLSSASRMASRKACAGSDSSFLTKTPTDILICSSTPLDYDQSGKISPTTSQLINTCLEEQPTSPFVSSFLVNLASMTSPLRHSGDTSVTDNHLITNASKKDKLENEESRTQGKKSSQTNATPQIKRARHADSFPTALSSHCSHSPWMYPPIMHCPVSPITTQPITVSQRDSKTTRRKQVPSISTEDANMMILGVHTDTKSSTVSDEDLMQPEQLCYDHVTDIIEKENAVEALLREQFS